VRILHSFAIISGSDERYLTCSYLKEASHEVIDVHPYATISELSRIDDDPERVRLPLTRDG
jgi:hypothetical protein